MAAGLVAWGTYVPYWRLERSAIAAALGTPPARGSRAVASYDENATSMGVEAGRKALDLLAHCTTGSNAGDATRAVDAVVFATASPPYLDKTNATAIHAALALAPTAAAYDQGGAARSAFAVLASADAVAARGETTLVVTADVRTGLPGGADESNGGDGAAAFVFAPDGAVVEVLGTAHMSEEFLDRWRTPGAPASGGWEERFGEHAYVPLGEAVVNDALKAAGLAPGDLDHVIVAGLHPRATRRVAAAVGAKPEAYAADLSTSIGNAGTAQFGIALADVFERARAGETILAVLLADGADAVVLRTTDALSAAQSVQRDRDRLSAQIAAGRSDLPYASFLTWREMLHREPPRRPDPVPPAAPPSLRREHWKFGFTASRCEACGTRHLPPARVCVSCRAVDRMVPERLADVQGTIATFTVDRLAFTLSPPVVAAVIDFDGGGRFSCEMTDLHPDEVRIGLRVEMTFRNLYTANGVHNYFWKARPVRTAETSETSAGTTKAD
jgi:3-hydroxy-3-methylglutaryl CoA synthase/uncharacterized OB-fold protein